MPWQLTDYRAGFKNPAQPGLEFAIQYHSVKNSIERSRNADFAWMACRHWFLNKVEVLTALGITGLLISIQSEKIVLGN